MSMPRWNRAICVKGSARSPNADDNRPSTGALQAVGASLSASLVASCWWRRLALLADPAPSVRRPPASSKRAAEQLFLKEEFPTES